MRLSHLLGFHSASNEAMKRSPGNPVPVGVFSQPVGIGTVYFALVHQAETVGQHDISAAGCAGYFHFYGHPSGIGGDFYHLAVFKIVLLRIFRMHEGRTGAFAFIPGRIAHLGVGVGIPVAAG